jgi:hypothetical protein
LSPSASISASPSSGSVSYTRNVIHSLLPETVISGRRNNQVIHEPVWSLSLVLYSSGYDQWSKDISAYGLKIKRWSVSELSDRLTKLEGVMDRIEKYMEKHEHLIFGNGQEGCRTRLKVLEDTALLNKTNIGNLFKKIGGINRTIWMALGFFAAINFFLNNAGLAQHLFRIKWLNNAQSLSI